MIALWCGLGMIVWLAGCVAYEHLPVKAPIKAPQIPHHDSPQPMCVCAARGSASMRYAYYASLNGGRRG